MQKRAGSSEIAPLVLAVVRAALAMPEVRAELAALLRDAGEDPLERVTSLPVPKRTALAAAREGRIRDARRVGRTWLAPRSALRAFVDACRAPVANDAGDEANDFLAAARAAGRRAR